MAVILLATSLSILILSANFASAAVIGANRGVISFRNVLKSGYAQEAVTLTTDTEFNLSVTYRAEGEFADWIKVEPAEQPFFISKDNPAVVLVIVEPPADAQNQEYTGSIRFLTGALAGPEGQFGTSVRAAINIRLGLQITGQEIVGCSAAGFELNDVEEGYPLEFYAVVSNTGNVRLRPSFSLQFWNQDQTSIVETFNFTISDSILPTAQKRVFYSFKHSLPVGQYWVQISSFPCGGAGSGFLTASVIERGGVSDRGELIEIDNEPWVKVGDIVPIDAIFKNMGSRVVSAKFKGTITSGDEIFKIIDTDPLDVVPGETVRLRTYFNPVQEGQYLVTGRVLYNKKLTFEKSSVINVNPTGKDPGVGQGFSLSLSYVILAVMAIIIILLLVLISRKKGKLSRKKQHGHRH